MSGSYVALLRGINVGGRNRIAMSDLRDAFAESGYQAIQTYIQSGNVLFEADVPSTQLEDAIEGRLGERFGTRIPVVVRSHEKLVDVVASAPEGFGADPGTHLSDVVFLKQPLTAAEVVSAATPREGVDRVWPGDGVVYFQRLSERRAQSRLSRLASTPQYRSMTIRNWSTTTRLLELLGERKR